MGKLWEIRDGKRVRTAAGIKHQYEKWDGTEEGKKKRSARNAARRSAIRSGKVHKGDGKDIDHIHGVGAGNGSKNLRVMSASSNRGRRQGSRLKGSKRTHRKRG